MNPDWRSLAHCVRIEMGPVLGGAATWAGVAGLEQEGHGVGLCSPRGAVQSVQEHRGGGGRGPWGGTVESRREKEGERWWEEQR